MKIYDAVIAGGGLIGASIALELAEVGLKVALYDAREPGQEASWASAGMISPAPENTGMIPFTPMSLASAALYPEFIRKVEELTGKDAGYRKSGALDIILERDVQKAQEALSTIVALQRGVGLHAEAISAEQARELEPGLSKDTQAAVFRKDEGSLDARAFTRGVLEAARLRGVEVFAGNGARALKKHGGICRGLVLEQGEVEAKWTIVAAGCFSARIAGAEAYAPVLPARGQMVALRCDTMEIQHILWLGHKYLVPRKDGRIVAGSTIEWVGFERHVTAGGIQAILSEVIKIVPALESARIEETWAGLRPDSPDHLPIIGPTDTKGLLIATGHFRSGVLLAPITALLIREWVAMQRVSVDWERVSPMRFLEAKGRKVVGSQLYFV
jgi:glycine oxidase